MKIFQFLQTFTKTPLTSTAMVLSGGGARGAIHLGVLKAFDENGIKIEAISSIAVLSCSSKRSLMGLSISRTPMGIPFLIRGITCSTDTISDFLSAVRQMLNNKSLQPRFLTFLNAHVTNLACRDTCLKQIIVSARIVAADGMSIVWAGCIKGARIRERCNMTEAFRAFLESDNMPQSRALLIGGQKNEVQKAAEIMTKNSEHCNIICSASGYETIEKYPLSADIIEDLINNNFTEPEITEQIHKIPWEQEVKISDNFCIKKIKTDLKKYTPEKLFDLIYFDAFAPEKQPELWTEKIFKKIYDATKRNGILVTYSAKGTVKQALRAAGFSVKRLPGPKGKRHMVQAVKIISSDNFQV